MTYYIIEHPTRGTLRDWEYEEERIRDGASVPHFRFVMKPRFSWSGARNDPETAHQFPTKDEAIARRTELPQSIRKDAQVRRAPARGEQFAYNEETLEGGGVMAVTILEVCVARLGVSDDRMLNGADFESVGLEIMGGCENCHATLAAYNGHPSKSGYWRCHGCLYGEGFDSVAEFEAWVAENAAPGGRS